MQLKANLTAMTKYRLKKTKTEESIVNAYKRMEESIVTRYLAIENAVVGAYQKIEEKFVDTFLEEMKEEEKEADGACHPEHGEPLGRRPKGLKSRISHQNQLRLSEQREETKFAGRREKL